MYRMSGSLGYSFDFAQNIFSPYRENVLYPSTLQKRRDRRTAGHGGNASFGSKSDSSNHPFAHFGREFEDVSTSRVFSPHTHVCGRQITRMAGVFEVIQELGRIHFSIVPSQFTTVSYAGNR